MTTRLLTLREAWTALGISRAGLYRLFIGGQLPWVRIGARKLVDQNDIAAFIAGHKHRSAA
jgi:predicted DNA-binding transcriptional regulator AlpA